MKAKNEAVLASISNNLADIKSGFPTLEDAYLSGKGYSPVSHNILQDSGNFAVVADENLLKLPDRPNGSFSNAVVSGSSIHRPRPKGNSKNHGGASTFPKSDGAVTGINKAHPSRTSSNSNPAADNDWHTIQRKRMPKLGKKEETSLRVVKHFSKPAEIFISRLDPETTDDQMHEYVKAQFGTATSIACIKLKTKFESYSSFHISLSSVAFADALMLTNWPAGALVKRYYAPGDRKSSDKLDDQSEPQHDNSPRIP